MVKLLKNPLFTWIFRFLKTIFLETKYRKKSLKINSSAIVNQCHFNAWNTIYEGVILNKVSLGDFTYVASNTKITNAKIGKFCSIGPDVKIGLGQHPTANFVSTHPAFFSILKQAQTTFSDQNYFDEFGDVLISNDVWIGANAIVLDGVSISDGAVVAAGAVVTKDVPPYAVVAGVPAKVIKYRHKKNEIDFLINAKWWDMDIEFIKKNYKDFHNIKKFTKLIIKEGALNACVE